MNRKVFFYLLFPVILLPLTYFLYISHLFFLNSEEKAPSLSIGTPPKEVLLAPCHFLGAGSQCLVFSTIDPNLVLKICKTSRYQLPFFLPLSLIDIVAPLYLSQKKEEKKEKKLRDLSSYELAATKLQKQTGITYFQVASKDFEQKLTLIDPIGIPHKLNTKSLIFYIQYRAQPLIAYVTNLSNAGKEEEIVTLFARLFSMVIQNASEGFFIKDASPAKNIGVLHDHPIWIDPGRIAFIPISKQTAIIKQFYQSIKSSFPSIEQLLEKALNTAVTSESILYLN